MRPRIPPLLPTYLLLVLVVVFAVGSLWVGLGQLDTIERLAESRAESAATLQELQSLASTLNDIVTSAQGYARNGASENLDLFERARRGVPTQLTRLRDRMRDSPSELALVERLVPLIARTTALADAAIEQMRAAPAASEAPEASAAYRDSVEAIRAIIANLESREQDDLAHDGRALTAALSSAQILQFALAGLSVLLVGLLFVAARRLSSFIPPAPRVDVAASVELGGDSPAASNARIAMLLDDAVSRARLAVAAARDDPAAVESLRSSIEAIERTALAPHGEPRPGAPTVVDGLALLARAYSQPGGLTVEPTLDRSVAISGREKAFVVDRVAEWGLEAVARRKRRGEITLVFSCSEDAAASLRVLALLDAPDVPLRLSPREREDADFLQRAAASLGGRLVVTHGPTGFALVLTLPLDG